MPKGPNRSFDAPDAIETFAEGINRKDAVAGWYSDINDSDHGFLAQQTTFGVARDAKFRLDVA